MNQELTTSLYASEWNHSKRESMESTRAGKISILPLSQAEIKEEEGMTVFCQFMEESEQIRAISGKISFSPNVDINMSSVVHEGQVLKRENIAKAVKSTRALFCGQ